MLAHAKINGAHLKSALASVGCECNASLTFTLERGPFFSIVALFKLSTEKPYWLNKERFLLYCPRQYSCITTFKRRDQLIAALY